MLALPFGLFFVLVLTIALFGLPVTESLRLVAEGAFGDRFGLARTFVKATPLLLAGLGIVIAWRAGMYNIGGEGQFVVGGLAGALAAKLLIGTSVALPVIGLAILLASMAGGAAWASLAGWLYARRGVEVVISTILLNFVALQLLNWAVEGPLKEGTGRLPLTDPLPTGAMLPRFDAQTDLHAGVFLALLAAAVVYAILHRTQFGFRLRLVGANPNAARSARIDPKAVQLRAMALSGCLCGLAGGVEYLGVAGQLGSTFAQGWGFLAIPVALLSGLQPLIMPVSALLFGALFAGTEHLGRFTSAGATLLYVVQGASVLGFVALKAASERRTLRREPA